MKYVRYLSAVINLVIMEIVLCHNYVSYTGPCRRSDPNMEKCLIKAFENAKTEFALGNFTHEVQLRPMDPFAIHNHIYGTGKILQLVTHEMIVLGLSKFKVERYKLNLDALTVDIIMMFPKISDTGVYSGTFNIFGSKFRGSFKAQYRNTRAFMHFDMQRYWKDGREFLKILDVILSSDKKFTDFKSTDRIHDIALPIVYPHLEMNYGLIIRDELNKVLRSIPLDQLLPV